MTPELNGDRVLFSRKGTESRKPRHSFKITGAAAGEVPKIASSRQSGASHVRKIGEKKKKKVDAINSRRAAKQSRNSICKKANT